MTELDTIKSFALELDFIALPSPVNKNQFYRDGDTYIYVTKIHDKSKRFTSVDCYILTASQYREIMIDRLIEDSGELNPFLNLA